MMQKRRDENRRGAARGRGPACHRCAGLAAAAVVGLPPCKRQLPAGPADWSLVLVRTPTPDHPPHPPGYPLPLSACPSQPSPFLPSPQRARVQPERGRDGGRPGGAVWPLWPHPAHLCGQGPRDGWVAAMGCGGGHRGTGPQEGGTGEAWQLGGAASAEAVARGCGQVEDRSFMPPRHRRCRCRREPRLCLHQLHPPRGRAARHLQARRLRVGARCGQQVPEGGLVAADQLCAAPEGGPAAAGQRRLAATGCPFSSRGRQARCAASADLPSCIPTSVSSSCSYDNLILSVSMAAPRPERQ